MTTTLRDRLAAALEPRYVLERELAAGGMGVVFLGHDPVLGRQVAIKVLPPERATAVAVERFVRESRLLAKLSHPHIVPVLEAHQQGDLLWFVMPHISGDTLAARLATTGPLSPKVVRRLGLELLDALSHSHRSGVIHRDIKPGNIFLQGNHALLADFGVAHLDPGDTADEVTAVGEALGTPTYMAPEQLEGGAATERSDVYSLGATLYEAVTGRRWRASEATDATTWRGVPGAMVRALRTALLPAPAERWPSAERFAAALASRGIRRRREQIGAALAVIALTIAGWFVWGTAPLALPQPPLPELAFLSFESENDSLGSEIARDAASELGLFPRVSVASWERSRLLSSQVALTMAQRVVTGSVVRDAEGGVSISVRIVGQQDSLVDRFEVPLAQGDARRLGAAVAEGLVDRLYGQWVTEFRLGAAEKPNPEAMRRFSAGQDAFQRDQWREAEAEFAAARRADSSFARATWHELIAIEWQRGDYEERLADLANERAKLPALLDTIIQVQVQPDLRLRLEGFDSLAKHYPRYPVLQQLRANELFSRGPLAGRRLREAVDVLDSSRFFSQLDQADVYFHTVWGAIRLGDEAMATAHLRLRKQVAPDDTWGPLLALAVDSRFHPFRARAKRFVMRLTADSVFVQELIEPIRFGLELDDPQDQLALGQIIATRANLKKEKATGEVAQATALLLLGRLADARNALQRASQLQRDNSGLLMQRDEWALCLPLFGVDTPSEDRETARRNLTAQSNDPVLGARAMWALLLDATIQADSTLALRWSSALHVAAAGGDRTAAQLEPLATALVLGMRGRLPEALGASDAIMRHGTAKESELRGPFVRSAIYFLRGQWRLTNNDSAGAEQEWLWHENSDLRGWPSGEPQEGELDAALSAIARLTRGEILLKVHDEAAACALLRRVGVLWSDADSGFAALATRLRKAQQECQP